MKKIIFALISIIFISCGNNEYEKRKELREQKERRREKIFKSLTKNYNIKYCWDTLDMNYTLLYEPVLKSKIQLIKESTVRDIFKKDSLFNLRISCGFYPSYNFTLNTSDDKGIHTLINNLIEDSNFDLILVVEIEDLKKGLFEINAIPEYDDWAYIELEYSDIFYGTGKILKLKIINYDEEN